MKRHYSKLLCGAAAAAILASAGMAHAEDTAQVRFDIPAQPLTAALNEFGIQSGSAVLFRADVTGQKLSRAFTGASDPETALMAMLDGTGLSYRREGQAFVIVSASDPQSGSAAGDGADAGTVAALVVTAQKKEENIQDVPIAISAFTEKALEEQKIEGGFDLLKAIPNVTFSKNNFTGYNFSIRGVGTKAISATTDPGVAVSYNNMALLQNRLFEQEYFDVERVEVLRGPQGTLYGRNATAGVINVITAKPNLKEFDGWVKGEVGNYHTKRASAMVNIPLIEDKLGIRLAGSLTDRQGYDYNAITRHAVNGRDLWSTRLTIAFNPTDRIRADLIWERFNEDDNRSRTGKQLCKHDSGPTMIGGQSTEQDPESGTLTRAMFSQGCLPTNLYGDDAFGTPNGLALPFVFGMLALQSDVGGKGLHAPGLTEPWILPDGSFNSNARGVTLLSMRDPYGGLMQSRDLREISSLRDPVYRAKADILALDVTVDVSDSLTLTSQTVYNEDSVYSLQDFNRFNTQPVFNDSSNWYGWYGDVDIYSNSPSPWRGLSPGGYYCDEQLGCSNTMVALDVSQAKGRQFGQEIRLASDYSGPINFSAGVNYIRFSTTIDYYVFNNVLSAYAGLGPFNAQGNRKLCDAAAILPVIIPAVPSGDPAGGCPYIDPNPIESINGEGHNYFRSKNPYRLTSRAAFGELYWQASEVIKVTAGLRYTDDRKSFTPVPSQTLLGSGALTGGTVSRGYPVEPDIDQTWRELTGRLGIDWQPKLSFTDQTLLYAFYSHGYKGGGANPPGIGFAKVNPVFPTAPPVVSNPAVNYGPTFEPEFVDAFEVGAKNTILGGAMILNMTGFYYDYNGYQVSKIVDRTSVNENFDANVWGLELETMFRPSEHLRVNANFGYLNTRIADGEKSIDLMNRTQSNPDWTVVKPWVQLPSNCIVPTSIVEKYLDDGNGFVAGWYNFCGGWGLFGSPLPYIDPTTGQLYTPSAHPEINGGAGFYADLSGNELPNAPHWTISTGAQYDWDLFEGNWKLTVRGDAYWQSQSWARVYNDNPYDKLHGWYNVNLSMWIERPEDNLKIELYAKNLLDKTPITDAFLNSDDSALTTNVFVLDPRLIGLSVKKGF